MDGRKRLSGAQYKKSAKEKKKRQDNVLSKTRKMQKMAALKTWQEFERMHLENKKKYQSAMLEFNKLHGILRESLQEAEKNIDLIMGRFHAATNDYEQFEQEFYKFTSELAKQSPDCQQILNFLQINEECGLERRFAQEAERREMRDKLISKSKFALASKMMDIKNDFINQFESAIKHSLVSEELLGHFKSKEEDFAKYYEEFVTHKMDVLNAISEDLDPYLQEQCTLKCENWDKSLKSDLNDMTIKRKSYEKKCLLERPSGEIENNNTLMDCNESKCYDFSATFDKSYFYPPALDDLMVSPLPLDSSNTTSDVVEENLTQTLDQSVSESLQVLDNLVSAQTPIPNFDNSSVNSSTSFNKIGLPNAYRRISVLPTPTLQPPVLPAVVYQQSNNRLCSASYSITYQGQTLNEPVKIQQPQKIKEQKITCQICKKGVKTKEELREHEEQFHQSLFKCPMSNCDYLCASKNEKGKHYLTHVKEEVKKNACKICFAVQSSTGLTHHMQSNHYMKTCDDMNSEYCAICYKKCSQNNLLTHMNTHRKLKTVTESEKHVPNGRYHCHICDKRFLSSKVLTIHLLMTHDTPPFTCIVCKATFRTKGKYDFHKNNHTKMEEMQASKLKGKQGPLNHQK